MLASALTAVLLLPLALAAQFECKSSSSIPYCVHNPGTGKLPLMVFMPGSGARGDLSNAASLATYDGMGKMINEYNSGNTDSTHTTAATKFITVVPISGYNTRHFWPEDIKAIIEQVRKDYASSISGKKTHIGGYSMGSRGCNRFAVTYPEMVASAGCSAGAAEQEGADTLTQDPSRTATATFPMLSNAVNLPMRNFVGTADTTAGWTSGEQEQAELLKLGSKKAVLTKLEGADHSGMSIKPWTDTDYLDWALKQSTGGSSGSGTKKPTPSKSKPKKHPPKASQTPQTVSTDEESEDCEDSEDHSDDSDSEEDDCEDEESSGSDSDDEDCEDEQQDSSDENTYSRRDSQPELPASFMTRRQPHHFVFPWSKRDVVTGNATTVPVQPPSPKLHKSTKRFNAFKGHRMIKIAKR